MGRARLDESGQAVPLLLGVLAVALVMVVAVGRVGEAAVHAARARTRRMRRRWRASAKGAAVPSGRRPRTAAQWCGSARTVPT